jgi:hypothetical protein
MTPHRIDRILLCLLSVAATASAGDRERLQGAWRFENEVDVRADGSSARLTGLDGVLIYTAGGAMSVTIMPRDRKWSAETASAEELRATIVGGSAYAGTYEVDVVRHRVTHVLKASLDPGDERKRLVRDYAFDGDALTLSGDAVDARGPLRFTVTWKRTAK